MVYCLQEIDRLSEHLLAQPDEGDKHALITAFCAAENSPALLILFSSISRVLIRLICRPLRHGWIHCINGAKTATNPTQKAHFLRVIEVYNKSPVCTSQAAPPHPGQPSTSIPAITFELFSAQVDSLIKDAYTAAGMSDAQRAAAEKEMFVRATIPDALFPAIMKLLTETWPRFIQQPGFDLGRAVKHDVAWLGFTEDRYTRAWQARHVVDVVRKTVLPRDARVRYCARCGSGMEDIVPSERYPGWVIGSMKNCLCLGNWGIVERKG